MDYIELNSNTHFLPDMKAIVSMNTADYLSSDDIVPRKVTLQKKEYEVVPWGDSDDLPLQIIEKIYKSPVLTSGHLFNINLGYGEGIMPCYIEADETGKKKEIPVLDNEEINLFFEENDISLYLPGWIVETRHASSLPQSKEAAYSRVTTMNKKTGKIEYHLYSAQWGIKTPADDEVAVTPILDYHNPITDLKIRMGMMPDEKGRTQQPKDYRFIVPVSFTKLP